MIEEMAVGTPVVTTNWGAAPELVEDGVTGFRRDAEDPFVEVISAVGLSMAGSFLASFVKSNTYPAGNTSRIAERATAARSQ